MNDKKLILVLKGVHYEIDGANIYVRFTDPDGIINHIPVDLKLDPKAMPHQGEQGKIVRNT